MDKMALIEMLKGLKRRVYIWRDQEEYKKRSRMNPKDYPEKLAQIYKQITGEELNLEHPCTYNEKIQWSKLYDTDPRKTVLSDKYAVRSWVREKIGDEYLVPLLGTWDRFDDIDFSKLPSQFVLKLNNGSATNIVVTDKSKLDLHLAKKKFKEWTKTNFAFRGFELQYKDIKPKIIAEEYLIADGLEDLPDYKFFCFDGKVFCSYTMKDYTMCHENGRLGFFDRDYKLMPYYRRDFKPILQQIPKPKNYEKMLELAECLAKGFPHVRVDFYDLDGKIYFGEMTFTNSSGYCKFEPEEFNRILGDQWTLPAQR